MATSSNILSSIILGILKALLWIEKELYFWTRIELPFLKKVWREQGFRLQKKLDKEHNTNFAASYAK